LDIGRFLLVAINPESQLARVRFWAFRTPAGLVKPREQQLAHPEAHHAMRVDYQCFTGTWITPAPFALFLDAERAIPRASVVATSFDTAITRISAWARRLSLESSAPTVSPGDYLARGREHLGSGKPRRGSNKARLCESTQTRYRA